MIRVLLVDDQSLLRVGFRLIIEGMNTAADPDIEVVGEAADGAAGLAMAIALRPDVVLMDVRMPGVDGISATRAIVAAAPEVRVLILTTYDLDEYVFEGLRAGASGFLLKDTPPHQLLAGIRTVHSGEAVLAPSATRHLIDAFAASPHRPADEQHRVLDGLTAREQEVFTLVAAGLSNREIAARLHRSESTIKIHVGRVLAKLQVRDRVQAVVLAYESGVAVPGQPANNQ